MANVPDEIARARVLLRQVNALPGSQARVYQRIMARSSVSAPLGLRVAFGAVCIIATTSALAWGYRWVAHRSEEPTAAPAVAAPEQRVASVPRKHQWAVKPASSAVLPSATALEAAAVDPPLPTTSAARAPAANRSPEVTGVGRHATEPRASSATQEPLQNAPVSELSLQVREYQQATSVMHRDPQLALARLQAYRNRWPRSAISEEVDLRVVEALNLCGRHEQAALAASNFVQRYPRSAHVGDMRRMAGEPHPPNH